MPILRLFAVFLLALVPWRTCAAEDPENFLVADFLFARPADWKWVWDESKSKQGMLLEVPGTDTNEVPVVYFRRFPKNEGNVQNRTKSWQGYFKEPADQLNTRSTTKAAGKFNATYVEMDGTYVRKSIPYALIGVSVKLKDDSHLAIRMSGPKELVEDSKAAFRDMVENALREKH